VKGDQPPLNAFANEVIPIVSGHLAMARSLKP
jgi:putative membrane protein